MLSCVTRLRLLYRWFQVELRDCKKELTTINAEREVCRTVSSVAVEMSD